MADAKIKISPEDVDKIIQDYKTQIAARGAISVEFSGVNNIDVLTLLRIMSKKEQSVDDIEHAAQILLDGQTITFTKGTDVMYTVNYNRGSGNALYLLFSDNAYLYDILQETVYALMLKKLTPHLEGSN